MTQYTTSNQYIVKDGNTNIINPNKLKTTKYINVENEEISLTSPALTSNHYLQSDEKAHCKGKWQDWFCIHNYHNNNNINNYPDIKTMSIGVCYNYCELRTSQPNTGETITKNNKCTEYYDENDLIYNPLALIAILGTHFNKDIGFQTRMPLYDNIEKTIGIRGSYLNDLYRVNKNDEFIKFGNILEINEDIKKNKNNQDKLLFNIIKYIVENNVYIIEEIKTDIRKACNNINNLYLKKIKGRPEQKQEFLSKIKNYVFDIVNIDKLYGKDKNNFQKLINIIAYTHNIMRLVCYEYNETSKSRKLSNYDKIKTNIMLILSTNKVNKNLIDNIDDIVDIFTAACYNCFNVNYDIFYKYMLEKTTSNTILIRINRDNINNIIFNEATFIKCGIDDAFFVKEKTAPYKYNLIYYNDVPYYDHKVLSEYSDNISNIDKILLGLLGFFIGVIIIFLLYFVLFYLKFKYPEYHIVDRFIYLINFSHLFYKRLTLALLNFSCRVFYKFVSTFRSKYIFLSLLYKIFNIIFIIFLLSYLFTAFIELLNIDYLTLLKNINYSNFTVANASSEDNISYMNIPYYILIIYLILIYMYSIYIIKYSLEDSQFDIIANIDSDDTISSEFIDYLLLSNHVNELLKYKSLYPHITEIEEVEEEV
jgi:hypothetical protein